MKTKNYFEKKDRGFLATWWALKMNQIALKKIKVIAQEQANLENCGQYVVQIGNKYCTLSTKEIKKNKMDLGKPYVLNINKLLETSLFIAYPKLKPENNGKKTKFRGLFSKG